MTEEMKGKWITALESGEYEQACGVFIQPGPNPKYCCLAVLGKVQGKTDEELVAAAAEGPYFRQDWVNDEDRFVQMNDARRLSFLQIAERIRAIPAAEL